MKFKGCKSHIPTARGLFGQNRVIFPCDFGDGTFQDAEIEELEDFRAPAINLRHAQQPIRQSEEIEVPVNER